jgi:hypothetical protein
MSFDDIKINFPATKFTSTVTEQQLRTGAVCKTEKKKKESIFTPNWSTVSPTPVHF